MYIINEDLTATDVGYDIGDREDAPLYGTMVGAVRFGGVVATPIRIESDEMFDTAAWFADGSMVSRGTRWTVKEDVFPGKP